MDTNPTGNVKADTSPPMLVITFLYRLAAYFGLFAIFGSLLHGFRFNEAAPPINFLWNALLYLGFIAPHLIMTRSWFKKTIYGNPAGNPGERRVYITVTVVTWLALLWFHFPMPGESIALPGEVRFAGLVLFLICLLLFFEGATTKMIDGLLGVPGGASAYSHGPETPLFTEGGYASVRHPMYRAAVLAGLVSLLVHPNTSQIFWAGLIGGTFIAFIPVEEAQMIRARGDDYHAYMKQTPWRIFRGVW